MTGPPENPVLLVSSGARATVAGVFALEGSGFERIDPISGIGMHFGHDQLARVVQPAKSASVAELLVYDALGAQRWLRVDGITDPHDVLVLDEGYLVVCSDANAIAVIAPNGEVRERWRAPTGSGDAWHVNCLAEYDGGIAVSAFGRFSDHRGWVGKLDGGHGVIFDMKSGENLVTGLNAPHHPRWVDGAWVACEARASRLVRVDPATGRVADAVELRGFVRALAVAEDVFYVGESAVELSQTGPRPNLRLGSATIAVVDRHDWTVVDRIQLPVPQLYDLVLVPPAIRDAVATGFRTRSGRNDDLEQDLLFAAAGIAPVRRWAVNRPLPPEACQIDVQGPATPIGPLAPSRPRNIEVTFTNRGGSILAKFAPYPVTVGCAWAAGSSGKRLPQRVRTPLAEPLAPGESVTQRVRLEAPALPGRYTLHVTLVQEGVRWFHDLDARNGWRATVHVAGRKPSRTARLARRVRASPRISPIVDELPHLRWLVRNLFARRRHGG